MEKKNYTKVFENMVERTKDYLEKNNLKTMVLGLSGGIDSTISAIVCHEISKRTDHQIQFIGVSLPSKTNESEENEIAYGLGVELCDKFFLHSIQDDFNNIQKTFNETTSFNCFGKMNPLQEGNIKARIRMMFLYNLASLTNGLVIDTDNLTEHYTGFFTIHGDQSDLCFTGSLWKHEIYELAKYLYNVYNFTHIKKVKECLKRSIDIIPTDGNGVKAGGDLEQIAPGMTYPQVDDVLCNEISDNERTKKVYREILYQKYGKDLVEGIINRYHRTEYKRKKLPIVINID